MINEIDENEGTSGYSTLTQQKSAIAASTSVLSEKQASREYMKTFSVPKRPLLPKVFIPTNKEHQINHSLIPTEEICKSPPQNTQEDVEQQQDSVFDDEFDMTQVEEFEVREMDSVTEEELLNGWETMQKDVENITERTVVINSGELPLVDNEDGTQVMSRL